MNRHEAEKIYNSGKEPTVEKLLNYDDETKSLKRKIAQLEKDSKSSSKPPSSDFSQNKEDKPEGKKKKRKPGGQAGHKGSNRKLIPVEEVDKVIPHFPDECGQCHKLFLQNRNKNIVGRPFRWQIAEIEPIRPNITEYQYFTLECSCGCQTGAPIPSKIIKSNFGPRLTGIIAYMTGVLHVPRRRIQEFCETILNVSLCTGSVQNLLEETSNALEPVDKELKETLPEEKVINADETGWKKKRWLWIFVAANFIYFKVANGRSSQVLKDVLGEVYKGILCVDRWGAYTKYHKGLMQLCWAHLKRDILGVLKTGEAIQSDETILFAKNLNSLRKRLMAAWYQFKKGKISRDKLKKKVAPIKSMIKRQLKENLNSEERCVRTLSKNLLKRFNDLFTFIYYEGVEPTNNLAERGIRPAVQWRKICFGNRSNNGAILTSRLLTVIRTCWLQKRNSLEFLVDAITANRTNQAAPTLL